MFTRSYLRNCSPLFMLLLALAMNNSVFTSATAQAVDEKLRGMENFWVGEYNEPIEFLGPNRFTRELLAKGQPDECFLGIGNPGNLYDPQYGNLPIACPSGTPKVNQAYVWGLTKSGNNIWFGTIANTLPLVLGGMLQIFGIPPTPIQTDSWVAEFGASQFSPPLPAGVGDWRPPRIFTYNTQTNTLTEKTPILDPLMQTTTGIRAAGTLGDVVILGGPATILPIPGSVGINLFAFNAQTGTYLGSAQLPQYNDIRKWVVVDGVLYAGVGDNSGGGKILRWIGDTLNPFQFEEVGDIDADASYITQHNNRLFVTTWGIPLGGGGGGGLSGMWMSPEIPGGGLTNADAGGWTKVWQISDYDPDLIAAATSVGGALASFDGYVYWGTMHVPFLATLAHFQAYGLPTDPLDVMLAILGTFRSISIFRGHDFGTPDQEIELLYGMPLLPAYNPATGWQIVPNNMGAMPLYGLSGFWNFFNTYTWSMVVYHNNLFVGTFDWSYIFGDMVSSLVSTVTNLAAPRKLITPEMFYGGDLFCFPSSKTRAIPISISGVGNYTNYGIRNMVADDSLYLGMANPMNLLTDPLDDRPEGGWELLRVELGRIRFLVRGDVNRDDRSNSTDALIVLTCDVGNDVSQFCPLNGGDVNGDGMANSTDALIILSHDVGINGSFNVGEMIEETDIAPCAGCN